MDLDGTAWFLVAATKIGVGIATQYITDVIENIAAGETGWDVFDITSSAGEYIAAGLSSLMSPSGISGAILDNVLSETILNVERYIQGTDINVVSSIKTVVNNSIVDIAFGAATDFVDKKLVSLKPINYSTYAGQQYKIAPNLTMSEIKDKKGKVYKTISVSRKTISFTSDVVTNLVKG